MYSQCIPHAHLNDLWTNMCALAVCRRGTYFWDNRPMECNCWRYNICTWTTNNLLKFNSIKCKYMVVSWKRSPHQPVTPLTVDATYQLNKFSHTSTLVFGLPLLWPGLYIVYKLKVSVKERGDKSALFIGCSMGIQTDQHYYNSILHYVRPHLEYAVPV